VTRPKIKDQKLKTIFTIENLPLNTLFIGQNFIEFAELRSTNIFAQELLSKNKPVEGTVISTRNQTAGRGQIGSGWESEPDKNINLSIILNPTFLPVRQQFQLNQAVSLAVRDFVAKFVQKTVKIKWPNDIYINGNKVSGILIQNNLKGIQISSSILGIGININQTEFKTNPPNPTSLQLEMQQQFDLKEMQNMLFSCIEPRYLQLKNGRQKELDREYLRNLYWINEERIFQRPSGDKFMGKIIGISPSGKLKIKSKNRVEAFAIKEVKFLH